MGLIFLLFCGFILLSLLIPMLGNLAEPPLSVGDVAPYDIHAPYAITYQSQSLTVKQQDAAAANVPAIYSPVDTNVARQQLERLRNTLTYIDNIRADAFATQEQKTNDLAAITSIQLSRQTILGILTLSNARWQAVTQETTNILDQIMRGQIRTDDIGVVNAKIPSLVSLSFPDDQAAIITDLVRAFIVPNSLYNVQLTDAARQQARDSVSPVMRSYIADEIIVQGGKVISVSDYETLQQYGLAQPINRWQDMLSAVILTLLTGAIFIGYYRQNPAMFVGDLGMRKLSILLILFILFFFIARISIPGHAVIPYVYPVVGFALTISVIFSPELAFISVIPMAFLISYGLPDAQILTVYYLLGSMFGIFTLRRAQRLTSFFWSAAAIAVSTAFLAVAFRIVQPTADWVGLATLALAAVINGIASVSIALILHYYLSQFLGQTTALQLIELSRPDHPLQQQLIRAAPGTYQHSLQLANLVEQAADDINANALLARVGALYHDIGKIANPYFFIENQLPENLDPHNGIDPETSSATIIRHVQDGLDLARKYHLPKQIYAFIEQHHGTSITRYQYNRAVELANGDKNLVDESKFRYAGPKPVSREVTLLMLADICEARVRAERPRDENSLRQLIQNAVKQKLDTGELDETQLTMQNLDQIIESFSSTLRSMFHPRIQYPTPQSEIKTRPIPNLLPGDNDLASPQSPESIPQNENPV